jgi:hypothetical protein
MQPSVRGYDPTMRALLKNDLSGSPIETFKLDVNVHRDDFHWLINMPKPKDEGYLNMYENETEDFVLFSEKDLFRGEVIRGRATRVWEAWKKLDMSIAPSKRKVGLS